MNKPPTSTERLDRGNEMYQRAKQIIPGGTQLFGKRQEMFAPGQWPTYFAENAKGER